MDSLLDKHVLVTGAASGIGRATALATARRGAILHLTDRDAAGLERTAADVADAGGRVALATAADVTDHDAVLALGATAGAAAGGSLDVVMNVAGVSTWGSIDRLEHADWRAMVEVNLMGPIAVLEATVPAMIAARRGGHVVNVASAAALLGLPWHAAYSASKFGLRGVSEVLRFDLARHRIGVSLVCPGGVATPLVDTVRIAGVDPANPRIAALKRRFERHAVRPEHVAAKIVAAIEKDRYLVFTSADIRVAHLVARWCPPLYAAAMRGLNDRLVAAAEAP